MAWKTVRIACLRLEYELTILRELEADAQRVDRVFVKPHRRGERAGQGVTLTHGEAPLHGYLESRRGESRLSLTNVRTAPVRRTEAVLLLHFRPALERVETGSRESIPKVPMCSYSTLARDQSPRTFLVRTDLSLESYHPLFSFIGDGIWLLWSARAGSDLLDDVCLQRCQFRQRHFFNVCCLVFLTHLVVPPAFFAPFGRFDFEGGINQALKNDLSHFRRICDRLRKVLTVTWG